MKYGQLTKQMVDFQKMAFDNWYNSFALLQNQAVSMMDVWLNHSMWLPENGRQAIQRWMHTCTQEGERFKAFVDQHVGGVETYVDHSKVQMAQETQKPIKQTKKPIKQQGE